MAKRTIKIAGAGVAGLTAAINLARAGHDVQVHEKFASIGSHYKENPQLLPNWFAKEDVVKELEACNVKINWVNRVEAVEVFLPNQKIIFYGKENPVGYTVLRGGERSLEKDLARQAENSGAKIILNSPLDIEKDKPDIVATGLGKPLTVGYGRVYKGNFNPKVTRVFFDPEYTPSVGYGYFFPHDNNTATVKISRKFKGETLDFKESLSKFKDKYLGKEIQEENFLYEFGSLRSFDVPETAIRNNAIIVGEAAGFQDELFRFGMRYAFLSGYFAAKSIIENVNYDDLWKKRFLREFKRTQRTRMAFEELKARKFSSFSNESEDPYQYR